MRYRIRSLGLVLSGLIAAVWLAAGAGSSGSLAIEWESAAAAPETPSGDFPPGAGFHLTPVRFRPPETAPLALSGARAYGWTTAAARSPFAPRPGAAPPATAGVGEAQRRLRQG